MPLVRFTDHPRLPFDWQDKAKSWFKGAEVEMTEDQAQRWIRRGCAEIITPAAAVALAKASLGPGGRVAPRAAVTPIPSPPVARPAAPAAAAAASAASAAAASAASAAAASAADTGSKNITGTFSAEVKKEPEAKKEPMSEKTGGSGGFLA